MKVRFYLNSGANYHSTHDSGWLDTVDDLGLAEGQWESMSEDEKWNMELEYWQGLGFPEYCREEEEG